MLKELEPVRRAEKVAKIGLPDPAACGRIPLAAVNLTKTYGQHQVFSGIDLAIDRGSRRAATGRTHEQPRSGLPR